MPLVVLRQHIDAFALPKLMYSELLGILSLCSLLAAWFEGSWKPRLLDRKDLLWAVLPLSVWVSVGLLTAEHPLHFHTAWVDWLIGIACLVGWAVAFPPATLQRLFEYVRWPGLVLAALGVLQFHGLYQPFQFDSGADTARLKVTSLAGAAGDLGAFLAIACLVWQLRWLRARRSGGASATLAAIAGATLLCLYGLAVTQTLTAAAALALGSTVLWLREVPKRRRVAVVLGSVAGLVLLVALVGPLRERVWAKVERADEAGLNFVLSGRLDAWRVASRMLLDHPLGIGHGAFRADYVPTKLALAEEGEAFYRGHLYPTFAQAHNEFLQAAAEWGWVGLGLLGWALYLLLRRLGANSGRSDLNSLVWSQLAAYLVLSLTHFPWHIALTGYPGLLVLGIGYSLGSEEES